MPPTTGMMPPGAAPPGMDPAMAGGAPPVDPATGQPMDPAMMDPAMAGGAPPVDPAAMEPDPLLEMIKQMAKDVAQTKALMATVVDQLGIKVPTKDILASGEDAVAEASMGSAKAAGYIDADSDGEAVVLPPDAVDATQKKLSLDASCQYAAMVFARKG